MGPLWRCILILSQVCHSTFSPTNPTQMPTSSPTSLEPTNVPTSFPTYVPTLSPVTLSPTKNPITVSPTKNPTTVSPTKNPTTLSPTRNPTKQPTAIPTSNPVTISPTHQPTAVPTSNPVTISPTHQPTAAPTANPVTVSPTQSPTSVSPTTRMPTTNPTTRSPTLSPTHRPTTLEPTTKSPVTKSPTRPTLAPTEAPTPPPTRPTPSPTGYPTRAPTPELTEAPASRRPTGFPTVRPSVPPTTLYPTLLPTRRPTSMSPTSARPTPFVSVFPTQSPSFAIFSSLTTAYPTVVRTIFPSKAPTQHPVAAPSASNSTISRNTSQPANSSILSRLFALPFAPTPNPVPANTLRPTGPAPASNSTSPVVSETNYPTFARLPTPPTLTSRPTRRPTSMPTENPTFSPTTVVPTPEPTFFPSTSPTLSPTLAPTLPMSSPTSVPSLRPTDAPSLFPTHAPSLTPTPAPTYHSLSPTLSPEAMRTYRPTSSPTIAPSRSPIPAPTPWPTESPTRSPTGLPTSSPTLQPSLQPTIAPSRMPSLSPTPLPTDRPTRAPRPPTPRPTPKATRQPTLQPSPHPSRSPTTIIQTSNPTTSSPASSSPTLAPTKFPSHSPTLRPTRVPSRAPTPPFPTIFPTRSPTIKIDTTAICPAPLIDPTVLSFKGSCNLTSTCTLTCVGNKMICARGTCLKGQNTTTVYCVGGFFAVPTCVDPCTETQHCGAEAVCSRVSGPQFLCLGKIEAGSLVYTDSVEIQGPPSVEIQGPPSVEIQGPPSVEIQGPSRRLLQLRPVNVELSRTSGGGTVTFLTSLGQFAWDQLQVGFAPRECVLAGVCTADQMYRCADAWMEGRRVTCAMGPATGLDMVFGFWPCESCELGDQNLWSGNDTLSFPRPSIRNSSIQLWGPSGWLPMADRVVVPMLDRAYRLRFQAENLLPVINDPSPITDWNRRVAENNLQVFLGSLDPSSWVNVTVDVNSSNATFIVVTVPPFFKSKGNELGNLLLSKFRWNSEVVAGQNFFSWPVGPRVFRVFSPQCHAKACCSGSENPATAVCVEDCSTEGVNLVLVGKYLFAPLRVRVGELVCEGMEYLDPAALRNSLPGVGLSDLEQDLMGVRCRVPRGDVGINKVISAEHEGLQWLVPPDWFSYAAPRVARVSSSCGQADFQNNIIGCERENGFQIALVGTGFGSLLHLLLDGVACQASSNTSDTFASFRCGPVSGEGLSMIYQPYGRLTENAFQIKFTECEPGYHRSELECEPCEAGKWSGGFDWSACEDCVPGKFSDGGAIECEACAAGRFADVAGMALCENCALGRAQPMIGSAYCELCTAGKYSNGFSCVSCDLGWQAIAEVGCSPCMPGSRGVQRHANISVCIPCAFDEFSASSHSLECSVCGKNQRPNAAHTRCDCASGYLQESALSTTCVACPMGADCSVLGTERTKLLPLAGYYPSLNGKNFKFFRCSQSACGEHRCNPHHFGRLCQQCEVGYGLGSAGCVRCPSSAEIAAFYLPSVLAFAFFVPFLLIWMSTREIQLGDKSNLVAVLLKVAISAFQLNSQVLAMGLRMPFQLQALYEAQSALSGGYIDRVTNFQCLLHLNTLTKDIPAYFAQVTFVSLLPSFLIIVLGIMWSVVFVCRKCIRWTRTGTWRYTMEGFVRNCWIVFFLLFPSLVANFYSLFECQSLDESSSTLYMVGDPEQTCYQGLHLTLLSGTVPLYLFWIVGGPVLACVLMFHYRAHFWALYSHEVPTRGVLLKEQLLSGEEPLGKRTWRFVDFLMEGFRSRYFFWELVVLLRKAVLLGFVIFHESLIYSTLLCLILFLLCLGLQLRFWPYVSKTANVAEFCSLLVTFLTFSLFQTQAADSQTDTALIFVAIFNFLFAITIVVLILALIVTDCDEECFWRRRRKGNWSWWRGFWAWGCLPANTQLRQTRAAPTPSEVATWRKVQAEWRQRKQQDLSFNLLLDMNYEFFDHNSDLRAYGQDLQRLDDCLIRCIAALEAAELFSFPSPAPLTPTLLKTALKEIDGGTSVVGPASKSSTAETSSFEHPTSNLATTAATPSSSPPTPSSPVVSSPSDSKMRKRFLLSSKLRPG